MRRALLVFAVAAAALPAGCGDDEPRRSAGESEEVRDRRGPLPSGWRRVVNRRAGFSLGIPPGWKARGARGSTLVRSGDRQLAVSISADRSAQGRRLSTAVYARQTLLGLRGYRRLRVGRAHRVRGARYPGASVTAAGTYRRTKVRQSIRAVVLRRRGRVTFVLLFFRSARAPGALYRPAVRGMIRSFRAQTPAL